MTTPIDFNGFMPMQWVFAVDPTQLNVSQTLTVKYGGRSVDTSNQVSVEPGVYMFTWDSNLADGQWKSWYFRAASNFDDTYTNFGSRAPSGRQRVVLPGKTNLRCYSAIDIKPSNTEPVVIVSLLPIAPLANAFE